MMSVSFEDLEIGEMLVMKRRTVGRTAGNTG